MRLWWYCNGGAIIVSKICWSCKAITQLSHAWWELFLRHCTVQTSETTHNSPQRDLWGHNNKEPWHIRRTNIGFYSYRHGPTYDKSLSVIKWGRGWRGRQTKLWMERLAGKRVKSLNCKNLDFPLCLWSWIWYRDYLSLVSLSLSPPPFLRPWQRLSPRTAAVGRLHGHRTSISATQMFSTDSMKRK